MRFAKTLLLLLFGSLLLTQASGAMAYDGESFSISGTVTDANWNPLPGALVALYDNEFNQITTQYTTESGYFAFEGVSVKTYLCNVRVTYTEGGTDHKLPGYYIPSYPAKGEQHIDPKQTHFDDYYLPGSVPKVCPTPVATPTPTPAPTAAPAAAADPNGSVVTGILLFAGGFIAGAAVATLACVVTLWRPVKK